MTTLSRFIHDLHESGRVTVPATGPHPEPLAAIETAAAAAAQVARRAAPGTPPEAPTAALHWGFAALFQTARFVAHRDLDAAALTSTFADGGPVPHDAATVFAVDVGLRHLPTLASWARAAAADDPLVARLTALGLAWPLSSVGMPGTSGGDLTPIVGHPTLLALYVDRIIATGDAARCADPRIRMAVAAALGDQPSAALLAGPVPTVTKDLP